MEAKGERMNRLKIKPLSNNEMWQGQRFKTKMYEKFRDAITHLLPKRKLPKIPAKTKLFAHYRWGFSSSLSDIDNPVKPLQDAIFERMPNDDRDVYFTILEKHIVPKGKEFIDYHIGNRDDLITHLEALLEHLKGETK